MVTKMKLSGCSGPWIILPCVLILFSQQVLAQNTNDKLISPRGSEGLRLATFDIDATPPVGSYLISDPAVGMWDLGLRCKGIVLMGAGQPIVLCAVDWCGIGDESNDAFRRVLAKAAGTIPQRVAIHTLHQHDAPMVDFGGEKILVEAGFKPQSLDGTFAREVMLRLETAVRNSLDHIQPISHIGLGEAQVYKVASNRSIFDKDGKVRATRWT